jgi:Zn-dependent protease
MRWSSTQGTRVSAAILLLASVLVYELSDSLVARSRSLKVDSITLFNDGGALNLTSEATTPGDEFFVAVVGTMCVS